MKNLQTFEEFLNESLNEQIKVGDKVIRKFASEDTSTYKVLSISNGKAKLKDEKTGKETGMYLNDLLKESLNEAFADPIRDIHFEIDPLQQEKLKIAYGKSTGEVGTKAAIDTAEYMLKKFRKENKFGDGSYVGIFLPGSYDAIHSKLGDGPHTKRQKAISWNKREYDKWVKSVASNGGAEHAFDMAQNAKNEPGLIDWVRKNNRDEDPLEVIQWAIEAYA